MADTLKLIRYEAADAVAFGPLSEYRALVNDDHSDLAIRTGIQTCRPGYETRPHWHPYVEILHILEGEAQAWEVGREHLGTVLRAGDTLVIPARTWHAFRVAGERTLRLLGTHLSSQRTVHYDDGSTSLGVKAPSRPLG
ncbi:MAG TPA: cupin domain-containing protein [Burkholderiales bacterium]|nr:cupin domain-containing protein [Burkholderiales bacterium]